MTVKLNKKKQPMVFSLSPSIPIESQQNISRVTFSQNIFITVNFNSPMVCSPLPAYLLKVSKISPGSLSPRIFLYC